MIVMNNLISVIVLLKIGLASTLSDKPFPPGFAFGASTSAYQVEGAWNESGKGEGEWDFITHYRSSFILDKSNGDVACDSYHKMDEDVAMLKNLGVDFYRFSIAWSRIVPNGNVKEGVNLAGVMYYKKLLKKLREANMEAMVTIFHFDLPKALSDQKMFINETLNDLFVDYARLAFLLFGSEVKYWVTFNEPRGQCTLYLEEFSQNPGTDCYTCAHNILKCHARVYHMYNNEFKDQYKGQVSIVLNTNWDEPASTSQADIDAAERKLLFEFGWFAHPVIFGDYPDLMKKRIRSLTLPIYPSRLPKFTKEEKALLKGSVDFLGLNHYSTNYATDQPNYDLFRTFDKDIGAVMTYDPDWEVTSLDWLKVVPFGMRKILKWIDDTYHIPIFITENGYVENGTLIDDRRINYYQQYFSEILDSIYKDNVSVIGYSTWSLMDNWEWTSGYLQKFGLYYVNFTSPNRERIPKKSVPYFKKVMATRCIVDNCTSNTT